MLKKSESMANEKSDVKIKLHILETLNESDSESSKQI
jgi:hypothetical protein